MTKSTILIAALIPVLALFNDRPAADSSTAAPIVQDQDAKKETLEDRVRLLMKLTGAEEAGKKVMKQTMAAFESNPALPEGFAEKFMELASKKSLAEYPSRTLRSSSSEYFVTSSRFEAISDGIKKLPAAVFSSLTGSNFTPTNVPYSAGVSTESQR